MKRWYLSLLLILLLVIPGAVLTTETPVNSPDTTSVTIGLIPSGSSSPFHQELIQAVKAAAGEANWTVIVLMPDSEMNISFQKDAMNRLIQDRVDLICLNTLDTNALAGGIRTAESSGIQVILYNTLVPAEGQNVTGYIGYNQYTGAREMGRYAALALDPSIDIFYGNSDEMAIGAALAAADAGKQINSDILCLGIDGNAPTLDMIENGTMTATLGVYPDRMGRMIVSEAGRVLKGEDIPVYLETPSVVVDAKNMDSYLNGSTWTEPVTGNPEVLASVQ